MNWPSTALRVAVLGLTLATALDRPLVSQLAGNTGTKHSQQIVVKIRNGKTGLPIWLASPYVFIGKPDPSQFEKAYRRTKLWGDAHVDVTTAEPREVRVWVDFIHRDCRFPEGDSASRTFDFAGNTLQRDGPYDIDLILSKGIVVSNLCSTKTQQPEPGVLTIYVIPATFKEIWYY